MIDHWNREPRFRFQRAPRNVPPLALKSPEVAHRFLPSHSPPHSPLSGNTFTGELIRRISVLVQFSRDWERLDLTGLRVNPRINFVILTNAKLSRARGSALEYNASALWSLVRSCDNAVGYFFSANQCLNRIKYSRIRELRYCDSFKSVCGVWRYSRKVEENCSRLYIFWESG